MKQMFFLIINISVSWVNIDQTTGSASYYLTSWINFLYQTLRSLTPYVMVIKGEFGVIINIARKCGVECGVQMSKLLHFTCNFWNISLYLIFGGRRKVWGGGDARGRGCEIPQDDSLAWHQDVFLTFWCHFPQNILPSTLKIGDELNISWSKIVILA